MDTILINELSLPCTIGVHAFEKKVTQNLKLNLEFGIDCQAAAKNDHIQDTIDYSAISQRILDFAKDTRFNLIETLGEEIAKLLLNEFSINWLRLQLIKPGAIPGAKHVQVCIERSSNG